MCFSANLISQAVIARRFVVPTTATKMECASMGTAIVTRDSKELTAVTVFALTCVPARARWVEIKSHSLFHPIFILCILCFLRAVSRWICVCDHPFTGVSCSERQCFPDCGTHGHCFNGTCLCKDVSHCQVLDYLKMTSLFLGSLW